MPVLAPAQWLEADLAGVDRCCTPWLVVGMHRPMYVPYPHKSNRVVGRHLQVPPAPEPQQSSLLGLFLPARKGFFFQEERLFIPMVTLGAPEHSEV